MAVGSRLLQPRSDDPHGGRSNTVDIGKIQSVFGIQRILKILDTGSRGNDGPAVLI
jgi:hypothetical protein